MNNQAHSNGRRIALALLSQLSSAEIQSFKRGFKAGIDASEATNRKKRSLQLITESL